MAQLILTLILTFLAIANGTHQTDLSADSIRELDRRLAAYLDEGAFENLQANYRAQIEWLASTYDDRNMGIYITLEQVELSMRNRAIKLYLVHVLRRIVREQFNSRPQVDVDASTLEAMRDLLVARAKLRAKLMMIRANELHWIALSQDFESFKVYFKPEEVKRLASLTPRESLSLSEELLEQTRAFERVRDLNRVHASMAELWELLDRLLDDYTGCKNCHELIEGRWSRAARLQRNFMVREWLLEHVGPEFRRAFEQDRATFLERKNMRVFSLNVMKEEFDQAAMEKWRLETLG